MLDGGSIGSILKAWKKFVHAVKSFIVFLPWLSVKSTVAKSVFTNTAKFPFGIKVLKEFICRLKVNSRKVSDTLLTRNSKRDIKLRNLLKRDRESAQILNLLAKEHLGIGTLNGVETMLDMGLLTHGYIGITDMRLPVRIGNKVY